MLTQSYLHKFRAEMVNGPIFSDVMSALNKLSVSKSARTPLFRDKIIERLSELGWSDQVVISPDCKIKITAQREDVGLCLQTGNMARLYADLLKLQTLYSEDKINVAIFLVPTKQEAKDMGSNIANFDRLTSELPIFSSTIGLPLYVIGIERD